MKGYKKVIGLVIAFAMVAGTLFATRVESQAVEYEPASVGVPSDLPQVGAKITCKTGIGGDEFFTPDTEKSCVVESITPYVISSTKWEYSLIVYFYRFKGVDDTTESTYSYLIYKENDYYRLERNANSEVTPKIDENYINAYLKSLVDDSDQDHIQGHIKNGYSMRWNIPATTSSPAPHEHNWQHGVIFPASEGVEGLEGDYCTGCNLTRNTSPIPAAACIMENRTQQIEWASPAKVSILEMTTLCSLPNYFMKMIDAKKNCDFTLRFTYNKKHYEIYIPAGTKFDNSLDWYGPEQLLAMFEYKELY